MPQEKISACPKFSHPRDVHDLLLLLHNVPLIDQSVGFGGLIAKIFHRFKIK